MKRNENKKYKNIKNRYELVKIENKMTQCYEMEKFRPKGVRVLSL